MQHTIQTIITEISNNSAKKSLIFFIFYFLLQATKHIQIIVFLFVIPTNLLQINTFYFLQQNYYNTKCRNSVRHDNFGDFRAFLLQRFSRPYYRTPLLLGTPFTLREGATAMATARAKALKMDSRQWWLSLP